MTKRFIIVKKVGQTPLEALEHARRRKHIPTDVPMAYAGRLDPMASGKLLILVGDECKNQGWYHTLDKEYEVEVLLGIGSDTGDVLGITERGAAVLPSKDVIKTVLASFVGPYNAPYPLFSSKTVNGKPLFLSALQGIEVVRPLQDGTIRSVAFKGLRHIDAERLQQYIKTKIAMLPKVEQESKRLGQDFRRNEVLASWEEVLPSLQERFLVFKMRVRTSSGVYMRTLSQDIAEKLGTKGLALSIHRSSIFLR